MATGRVSRNFHEASRRLIELRRRVSELHLPQRSYAGFQFSESSVRAAFLSEKEIRVHRQAFRGGREAVLASWLRHHCAARNEKLVAAFLSGDVNLESVASRLWLSADVVPLFHEPENDISPAGSVSLLAHKASDCFEDGNAKISLGRRREVNVGWLTGLNEYRRVSEQRLFDHFLQLTRSFRGKKLVFFSATAQGGGVALMRHALIRLLRLAHVDAHWHVLKEHNRAFVITKTKFHNILQGVADQRLRLTPSDMDYFTTWSATNAQIFGSVIQEADVVVIDDPQPVGLIPHIRQLNPRAKIIYRSHIHLDTKRIQAGGTPQSRVWRFIWEHIKEVDCFVSHPVESFVPRQVPKEKLIFMSATTDFLDGLNKPLAADQKRYYLKLFNKHLLEHFQDPLDLGRPYIIQVARFDPSKGISDVLEAYRKLCIRFANINKRRPQLVIIGNVSVDDPEGVPLYNRTLNRLRTNRFKALSADIKVAKLSHIDQMLNALLCGSSVALQLSYKEGFEVKVSEALAKSVPVVAYRTGGIPLQIREGKGGYLVDTGDIASAAERLFSLLTDRELLFGARAAARESVLVDVDTVSNAVNWLSLANWLVAGKGFHAGASPVSRLGRRTKVH